MRINVLIATAILAGLAFGQASKADPTLYSNGPIDGFSNGYIISNPYEIANSFVLSDDSTITGVTLATWLYNKADTFSAVDWAITSAPLGGGTVYASGVAAVSQVFQFLGYGDTPVFADSFATPSVDLSAGTYWLNLDDAVVNNNDTVFWLEAPNGGGPSNADGSAYDPTSLAGLFGCGSTCSETFAILGTADTPPPTATPEPASLALLGVGLAGLSVARRRKT